MLSLGVPGSGPAAILLGALTLHGVIAGPMLATNYPTFIPEFTAILLLAALFMRITGYLVCQVAPKILSIQTFVLMPIIGSLCVIGSYAIYCNLSDVKIMFFVGIIGYVLDRLRFPAAPVVLGIILGNMCDENIRRALLASKGSLEPFYTRPIAVICIIAIAFSFFSQTSAYQRMTAAIGRKLKRKKTPAA
jgi:putative tricarboxylic transport membrane protein